MTWSQSVGSAGLVLDIIGVAILFKTGLPSKAIRHTGVYEAFDPKMAEKYDRWSSVALSLIILGFFLQIVSNFI